MSSKIEDRVAGFVIDELEGSAAEMIGRPKYFDRDGNPLKNVFAWATLFENNEYKRVAIDVIGVSTVSTVWLGLDHGWGSIPIIFETLVIGGPLDGECNRYATIDDAKRGHAEMAAIVREKGALQG